MSFLWCPNCREELPGCRVTYAEHCDTCGANVVSVDDDITQERIDELIAAEREQRCVVLPVAFGEAVYRVCACDDIHPVLDGTMYSHDGSPGTATGWYCPYELNDQCPHDTDDCGKCKRVPAVFEDCLAQVVISRDGDETMLCFENTPACDASDFGKTVFLTRAAAQAALACGHKAADGACNLCSDSEVRQPCVDGPCEAALAGQEEGRG